MTDDPNFSLKCFIFGYFGWYNFGDDAIGLAILRSLSEKLPSKDLTVTVKEDYFLSNNYHGNVERVNFNLPSLLGAIRKSDIFIIAGGTHFQDEDSKKSRRIYVMGFFTLITLYARLFKSQIIIFGHSIGPIKYSWSKFIVNFILKSSKFILVRDEDSFNFVKSLGLEDKSFSGFDVAIGLVDDTSHGDQLVGGNLDDEDDQLVKDNSQDENNSILGISILPFYEIYYNNPHKDDHLINEVYNSLKLIQEEDKDLKIKLFAFRSGDKHSDEEILGKLQGKLLENSQTTDTANVETVVYDGDIKKFISELAKCSSFLGMRYHSILFAYCLNKPFIALDYMKKCRSLTKDVEVTDKAVMSLENMDSDKLYNNLKEMLSHPEKYQGKKSVEDFRKLNKKGYEEFYKRFFR